MADYPILMRKRRAASAKVTVSDRKKFQAQPSALTYNTNPYPPAFDPETGTWIIPSPSFSDNCGC